MCTPERSVQCSSLCLEHMPVEILAGILQQLDFCCLISAVLSGKAMHDAYKAFPKTPSIILQRIIPQNVAPLAIAAFVVRPSGHSVAPWREVIDSLIHDPSALLPLYAKLRWREITSMYIQFEDVEDLAIAIADDALPALLNQRDVASEVLKISDTEQFRLHRALYMIEILNKIIPYDRNEIQDRIDEEDSATESSSDAWASAQGSVAGTAGDPEGDFPLGNPFDEELDMALFEERTAERWLGRHAALLIRSLAPWVVDQIACAYGWLSRQTTSIFARVEMRHPELMATSSERAKAFDDDHPRQTIICMFMRKSLFQMRKLLIEDEEEDEDRRVSKAHEQYDPRRAPFDVLDALWHYHCWSAGPSQPHATLSSRPKEELDMLRAARDPQDEEPGPFEAWYWLYKDSIVEGELPCSSSTDQPYAWHPWRLDQFDSLERVGYCFWDRSRPSIPNRALLSCYDMALNYESLLSEDEDSDDSDADSTSSVSSTHS